MKFYLALPPPGDMIALGKLPGDIKSILLVIALVVYCVFLLLKLCLSYFTI